MSSPFRNLWTGVSAIALFAIVAATWSIGCESAEETSQARVYQTTDRSQLIGGPGALGEVGDYVLENDQIRVVVQDISFNRGTGLFGGSLIDADLVRHDAEPDPFGGGGRDAFGEVFPAFFLEVINPDEITIVDPAQDLPHRDDIGDDAAVLEVTGYGGEFVTMLRFFNQAMVNAYDAAGQLDDLLDGKYPASDPDEAMVKFTARYVLEPGDRHVQIESELTNLDDGTLSFPSDLISTLAGFFIDDPDIDFDDFRVPIGSAIGFGAINNLFVPGLGYDIRFGIEDVLSDSELNLPALPGHTTDMLATSSDSGISYGYASAPDPDGNYAYSMGDYYGDVDPHEMLFLFEAAGYGGAFTHMIPEQLEPQESFRAINHFIIGSGDVASVRDVVYDIHDVDTHTVSGRMYDEYTGEETGRGAQIFLYEAIGGSCIPVGERQLLSQAQTNRDGYFEFQLPPGDYCYRTRYRGDSSEINAFSVDDGPVALQAAAPSAGRIEAYITDATGEPIPAKMTITGEYEPHPDLEPREHLFDLSIGERWRTSESVDIDPDAGPVEYIENIEFSSGDGHAAADVIPGTYTVYFSRGAEYDLVERTVEVGPADIARVSVQLQRQFNPEGYLSGDYHLHAEGSIDSGLDYNDRVVSVAAEGVEVAVATDHNYISDYTPYIHRNGLQQFLRSIVGLELTTMEAGHFNAFPLRQDIASPNRGSVAWQNDPPDLIFERLREMGSLSEEETIVQVNHPRDSILGYFNQHYLDGLTGVADLPVNTVDDSDPLGAAEAAALSPSGPAFAEPYEEDGDTKYRSVFSYDFDAIEVFNGKRIHLLHHFRMPWDKDDMPEDVRQELTDEQYEGLPDQAGVILCDGDDVAYPGGLDDWFNFLNYRRPDGEYVTYTATANSDSHHYGSPDDPEPGFPKNYFYAGHDDPQQLDPAELSKALRDHHNIVTNGAFLNMSVDDEPIGTTVAVDDGEVVLDLEVMAADWYVGDGSLWLDIVANGERIMEEIPVDVGDDGRWTDQITVDLENHPDIHHAEEGVRDTWFVVELEGDNNLFPVVQPAEIPFLPFDEALGGIAEPLGFGESATGIEPQEVTDIPPIAITNPIWVIDDADGEGRDEFIPPEPPKAECVDGELTISEELVAEDGSAPFGERRLDAQSVPHTHDDPVPIHREQGELRDVRTLFEHWHDH